MRISIFLILVFATLLAPIWLVFILSLVYVLRWPGYELILFGAVIDSAFGHTDVHTLPLYTLSATALVIIVMLIRPYLAMFNEPT